MSESVQMNLQAALGGAYRVERELGGGGMSRVFLAEETRLGRRIVIKVLTPEVAGNLSAERFEREVLVAAALQEPHIVPVLNAGDADGMPYYTMPFVEGPSLRQHMQQGRVPTEFAVSVLRDVLAALAYAHARGIVHRDIKPDNVLLSGNTAVVTDFGIAKALTDARFGAKTGVDLTLTAAGTSLGSPAYMAPEQASGDAVDARADLYSFGVMAYELLAGEHPFATQGTAQQMIAAHLTETPLPLATANPAINAPLADIVMRCLEKRPDARPASAAEIGEKLSAIATGASGGASRSPPRRRRLKLVGLAVLAAVLVAMVVGYALIPADLKAAALTLVTRPDPDFRVRRAVVAPLANETGDPSLTPLGAMASDAITAALSGLRSLETVDARTVEATSLAVDRIPRLLRRGSSERAIAAETGAGVLVTGSYFLVGDSVQFRTRIVNGQTGAVLESLPLVSAARASPTSALSPLSRQVVVALRVASDSSDYFVGANALSSTPSIAAYEAVGAAYRAFLSGDTTSIPLLRRALALDSMYGSAVALLPAAAEANRKYALADSALERAARLRDRLTPFEQAAVDEIAATRNGDVAGLVRASTEVVDVASGSEVLKAQLAYALLDARQPRRALGLLRSLHPDRGVLLGSEGYWWGLSAAYAQLGELRDAIATARAGDKRVPGRVATITEGALLAMQGDTAGASAALGHATGEFASDLPEYAAAAAALLANRDETNAGAAAKEFAEGWLARSPSTHERLSSDVGRLGLLAICERWAPLLALADSLNTRPRLDQLYIERRLRVDASRAIAYSHLGKRDSALAIDRAIAAMGKPPWARGAVSLTRARIAAHLGDSTQAITLLDEAIQETALDFVDGVNTFESDPFLVPLREYKPFHALSLPSTSDARR